MSDVTQPKAPEFSKFKAAIWPIHGYEMKKFLPMSFLMFCILFVYTMIRDLKDTFIQTQTNLWLNAKTSDSANLISALKFFFVLPVAFLAVMIFTKLVGKFGSTKTFYIIVTTYIIYFAIFIIFIYPNVNHLIASPEKITQMRNAVPGILKDSAACIGNWPFALFYVMAEIWGTMAISSLFWQFANATTMKHEIKRFFGLFSLIGNIGVVICGGTIAAMSNTKNPNIFSRNVIILIIIAMVFCLFTMGIYYYINKYVLTDPKFFDASAVKTKKKKAKVSTMEGIKILCKSPYMLLITVLVLGYGVAINFSEAIFNNRLKQLFPDPNQFGAMKGKLSIATGIFTIIVVLISSNILRRCKWRTSALLTPLLFICVGIMFFILVACDHLWSVKTIFGIKTLILAVWFGLIQDALVKSVKYSLFDTTKSMTYIPLDEDTKTKGQAAVEVIGGRAGKAGASLIQQLMFASVVGSNIMTFFIPVVAIFSVTLFTWVTAIFKLNVKYEKAVSDREAEANKVSAE